VLADTLVARALERNGLCYGDKATREAYTFAVIGTDCYGGRLSSDAMDFARKRSSCLVYVRQLLADDEVDGEVLWRGAMVDVLRCPYLVDGMIGRVEGLLVELGRQRSVLIERVYESAGLPELHPADLLVIGQGGSAPKDAMQLKLWREQWGGIAHGMLVTAASGHLVRSSDGGQRDADNGGAPTAIAERERRLERRGNGWWLVSAGDARRLNYVIRCAALPVLKGAA
jgi:hypothetical protein